ncbi:hypothetical protein D9M72_274130 [compost metagenome]
MRGRGLSPHHLLPRPSRRDGDVHRHAARQQGRLPGAAVERQPRRPGRAARGPPLRQVGRPLQETQLPVRPGGGQARGARAAHHRAQRQGASAAGVRARRRPRQDRARHELAGQLRAVGRSPLRPAAGPRPLHDRGHQRLQHGRHGEQGPEHLQHEVRSGQPGHRHRRRLQQHRKRGRPRVLPQLERRPRDLPRLVPAVAERRPHRLPRPGVQPGPVRRRFGPRREAHRGRARAAHRPVPRRRRPHGPPGAARQLHRDQQLLHRHHLRKGCRGRSHDADAGRPQGLRKGHHPVLRAPRRPGRDLRRLRPGHCRRQPRLRTGPPAAPVQALVQPGRHAPPCGAWRVRRAEPQLHPERGAKLPAHAGPADKRTLRHSAEHRPARRRHRPRAAHAARGRKRRGTRHPHHRAVARRRADHLRGPGRRARAVDLARLQRAGDPRLCVHRRPAAHPAGQRPRPVQPLGSRPTPGPARRAASHCRERHRHHAGAERRLPRRHAQRAAPPAARRRLQGTGAHAAVGNLHCRAARRGRSAARAPRARSHARPARHRPLRRLGTGLRRQQGHRRLHARPDLVGPPRAGRHGAQLPVPGGARLGRHRVARQDPAAF